MLSNCISFWTLPFHSRFQAKKPTQCFRACLGGLDGIARKHRKHSFIRSFIRSFVRRSYVHLLRERERERDSEGEIERGESLIKMGLIETDLSMSIVFHFFNIYRRRLPDTIQNQIRKTNAMR